MCTVVIYLENIFVHYYLPSARSSFLSSHIPSNGEGNRGKDNSGVSDFHSTLSHHLRPLGVVFLHLTVFLL